MKYMLMFVESRRDEWEAMSEDDRNKAYEEIGKWWGEHARAGRILDGHELKSPKTATTIRFNGGKAVVTDGPFVEAKETIGGYAIVDVPDLDSAIAMAKGWPAGSTVEIRPVVER
jgi:hypothetical protein